jgi:hypothetical protein
MCSAASRVASGVWYTAVGFTGYASRGAKTWNWLSHAPAGGMGAGARGFGSKSLKAVVIRRCRR